jgi:histidinol phosphatase-like PHP family hydrolase/predicted nuclease with RNAse H fold
MAFSRTEPVDYLRDFEFAQPIYDLAFGLEVLRYLKDQPDGNYRSTSLWMAAYKLDGYSTSVKRMLLGRKEGLPDLVPSQRIAQYLTEIDKTSTLSELADIRKKLGEAPFRLRKISGMGPATISSYLKANDAKRREIHEKLSRSARSQQLDLEQVAESSDASIWQKAHVYPPAYRLLKHVSSLIGDNLSSVDLKIPPEEFIHGNFLVVLEVKDVKKAISIILKVGAQCPGFISTTKIQQQIKIEHVLGFLIEVTVKKGTKENIHHSRNTLPVLEYLKDPRLPRWVQSDLHMHSTWSDGVATVLQMANSCHQMGLSYAAITEHSRSRKGQNGLQAHQLLRHISLTKRLNENLRDFRLVPGIEVDILDDGTLDLPPQLLRGLGWVVGSVHSPWTSSADENSMRLIRAVETGALDAIGHPSSRLIGKPGVPNYLRSAPPLNWPVVFDACAKHQVALEVNCFPARLDLNRELAAKAIAAGCYLYIASDAHATTHLPLLSHGVGIVQAFPREQVINSFDYGKFVRHTKYRRNISNNPKDSRQSSCVQGDLFDAVDLNSKAKSRIQITVANVPLCPKGPAVIGLDLTASPIKKSGLALLRHQNVQTKSLSTDAEIIRFIKDNNVSVVSIDSPLGLPGGGKTVNKDAGIVRAAERELASIGIHAYPALIPSMAPLTLRGIRLAKRVLKEVPRPPEVIESYPGAAQDLLSIPRKQRSLEELREGLRNLGLRGPGLDTQSHDEIDAITSAVVGRLYSCGQTLPLGKKQEAFLHVPLLTRIDLKSPLILFLTGPTSAGKSTLALYLTAYYNAYTIRTRDIIRSLLVGDGNLVGANRKFARYLGRSTEDIPASVLRDFGVLIRDSHEQKPLIQALLQQIGRRKQIIVVDAARTDKEIAALKRPTKASVVHWHVDAPFEVRQQRFLRRSEERSDNMAREFAAYHAIDMTSFGLARSADAILYNNTTLEQFHVLIDESLFQYLELNCLN